jgi:flagellar protein FliL
LLAQGLHFRSDNDLEVIMSDAAKPEAAGGGNKKLIIIIVVAVLVSVGAAVGVTLALTGGAEKHATAKHDKGDEGDEGEGEDEQAEEEGGEEGEHAAAAYVSLEPAFVVNFQDQKQRTKYLKAEISVVAATPKVQEALTLHMPAVRNSLVLLLSRQVFEDLATNEGKEKLRTEALEAVQKVIKKQASKKTAKGIKDLYFASLVMQ